MRGAVVLTTPRGGLRILEGEDVLTTYKFHSKSVRHYFCSRCGIYTHHERRSDLTQGAVNAACIEGVSPFDFREVLVYDGVNHPVDTGKSLMAGTLRFIPADEEPVRDE